MFAVIACILDIDMSMASSGVVSDGREYPWKEPASMR